MKNHRISRMFDLSGRTIILTGSSGFLGSQYSNILSQAGAIVILVDIDKEKNEK